MPGRLGEYLKERFGEGISIQLAVDGCLSQIERRMETARAHSSIDPFNNPIVRAGAIRVVIYAAIASLVVGIGLGWLVSMVV